MTLTFDAFQEAVQAQFHPALILEMYVPDEDYPTRYVANMVGFKVKYWGDTVYPGNTWCVFDGSSDSTGYGLTLDQAIIRLSYEVRCSSRLNPDKVFNDDITTKLHQPRQLIPGIAGEFIDDEGARTIVIYQSIFPQWVLLDPDTCISAVGGTWESASDAFSKAVLKSRLSI